MGPQIVLSPYLSPYVPSYLFVDSVVNKLQLSTRLNDKVMQVDSFHGCEL